VIFHRNSTNTLPPPLPSFRSGALFFLFPWCVGFLGVLGGAGCFCFFLFFFSFCGLLFSGEFLWFFFVLWFPGASPFLLQMISPCSHIWEERPPLRHQSLPFVQSEITLCFRVPGAGLSPASVFPPERLSVGSLTCFATFKAEHRLKFVRKHRVFPEFRSGNYSFFSLHGRFPFFPPSRRVT